MRKSLSTIVLLIGMGIFASIVFWQIDIWAQKSQAELKLMSTTLDWEGYLYQKEVKKIVGDK